MTGVRVYHVSDTGLTSDAPAADVAALLDQLGRATRNPHLAGAARWVAARKGRKRGNRSAIIASDMADLIAQDAALSVERAAEIASIAHREALPSLHGEPTLSSTITMAARYYRKHHQTK